MTLAGNVRPLGSDRDETATSLVTRLAASLTEQTATISTLDGRYITGGIADFRGTPGAWSATLRHLDRPGLVASLYFADGVRDVMVRLEDGRRARARITGTSFIASAQRVCSLTGAEALA